MEPDKIPTSNTNENQDTTNVPVSSTTPPVPPTSPVSPTNPTEPSPLAIPNPNPSSPIHPKNHTKTYLVFLLLLALVVIVILSYRVTSNKIDNNTSKSSSTKTVNVVAIAPAQVSITKNGFSPQTIKIKVNQGIIWTNNDTAQHQVSSDPYPTDNGLADFNQQQPMSQNQSWDFVFSQTGTFSYHDNLNPYTFKGTVIVVK